MPISFPDHAALTGSWRTLRPVLDREKCTKCGFCWLFCPEGTIKKEPNSDYYIIDLDYCKGCGICANECPAGAITMIREEEAHKKGLK
ncbi:MAG: 4Fe-4S binding protein [Promethearchaeota archaeon]